MLVRSYDVLARQNRAEDTSPWEIMSNMDPAILQSDLIIKAAITNPMWLTDEKAIKDFRSVCREQRMAERSTPNIEKTIRGAAAGI